MRFLRRRSAGRDHAARRGDRSRRAVARRARGATWPAICARRRRDRLAAAAGRIAASTRDRHVHLGAGRRLRRQLRLRVRALRRRGRPSSAPKCGSSSRRRAAVPSDRRSSSTCRRATAGVAQPFMLAGWAADLDAAGRHRASTRCTRGRIRWPAARRSSSAPPTYGGVRPDVAAVHGDAVPRVELRVDGAAALRRAPTTSACSPTARCMAGFVPASPCA